MQIKTLTRQECIDVLSASCVARLACARDGQPYVVPIHHAFSGNYIFGFSMPGQKIDWMRANPLVCVEVHEAGHDRQWRSVVMNGVYEELPDSPQYEYDRDFAWSLLRTRTNWWEPGGLKPVTPAVANASNHVFFRIRIDTMTGRQAVDDTVDHGGAP